ncbi:MAG: TetR/AcrR family transcriptional regulator [Bacteroidota bacterium]
MKERILLAAQELFFKYGIRSISMDDIAKHLSISKKTIYQFFKNKDEVVQMLMVTELNKNRCDFNTVVETSENVIVEFFGMMKHVSALFSKINPILFYDIQKFHSETWKLFKEFKENCILKLVEESLVKGMKQGFIRADINPKILARMRIEQVDLGFNPNVFPPDKFKIVDVQIALLDHFLYGVCTLKGHKLINKHKQIIEEE